MSDGSRATALDRRDDRKHRVKGDAAGAFAPSTADRRNDGSHSAEPSGDRDATRGPDDHSAVRTPKPDAPAERG